MTDMKHTPGPWKVIGAPSDQDPRLNVVTVDDLWIADVRPAGRKANPLKEQQANALLIAAAPALFKALDDLAHAFCIDAEEPCIEVINALGDKCHQQRHGHLWSADGCYACAARAAIAKAKGGAG